MAQHKHPLPTSTTAGLTSGANALMEYPNISQAGSAAVYVMGYLKGEESDTKDVCRAIWIVIGYGKSVVDGQTLAGAPKSALSLPPEANAAKAATVEHLDNLKTNGQGVAKSLPWSQIIALLLALLQELTDK